MHFFAGVKMETRLEKSLVKQKFSVQLALRFLQLKRSYGIIHEFTKKKKVFVTYVERNLRAGKLWLTTMVNFIK